MYVNSYKAGEKQAIIIIKTKIYVGGKLCITLDGSGQSDYLVGDSTYFFGRNNLIRLVVYLQSVFLL